jgi:hypothetical protein
MAELRHEVTNDRENYSALTVLHAEMTYRTWKMAFDFSYQA